MAAGYRISAPYFEDHDAFEEHVERMKRLPDPNPFQQAVFVGLQGLSHVYAGTVPEHVVARRRRRNKQARRSRRINRLVARR